MLYEATENDIQYDYGMRRSFSPPSEQSEDREGEFDARFASQRMSEVYPEKLEKPQQFEIDITSAVYPLTIRWELAKGNRNKFTLTDVQEGKLFGSVALNEKGELNIIDPKVTKLVLKVQSGGRIPTEFALRQNYPNPFNPSAIIEFDLPRDASVTLKIYDILGREVTTVKDNEQYEAGTQQVSFDASNFATGVYFYRITVVGQDGILSYTDVKKMLLLR